MNPYVVAGYAVYWHFPTVVERLSHTARPVEIDRIARQLSDDTFWVLTQAVPAVWTRLSPEAQAISSITVPAGEPLGGHRVVQIVAGKAYYASTALPESANCVAGVSMGAAAVDTPVSIQLAGEMLEPSWNWIPNLPVFLGVDGALVQVAPVAGFQIVVGKPTISTGILIDIKQPIVLL